MAYAERRRHALERIGSLNMSYTFATDAQSRAFFDEIAARMMNLFTIGREEAVGRMNRLWEGQTFIGPDDLIYHEDEEFWANTVFYGGDSKWWTNPPDLKPLPYP
jgi:hypothetical protein